LHLFRCSALQRRGGLHSPEANQRAKSDSQRTDFAPLSHRNVTAVPFSVTARARTVGVYAAFNANR